MKTETLSISQRRPRISSRVRAKVTPPGLRVSKVLVARRQPEDGDQPRPDEDGDR